MFDQRCLAPTLENMAASLSEDEGIVYLFTFLALSIVTVWVLYTASYKFSYMAYGMFIPSISAIITLLFYGQSIRSFITDSFFINGDVIMQCIIASWTSGIFVILSIAIGVCAGWTKIKFSEVKLGKNITKDDNKKSVHEHNQNPISGFIRAGGEELGMRCLLLPRLLKIYGKSQFFYVSHICGIIWALSHLMLMIILTNKFKTPNRWMIIIFQFVSIYFHTFFINWLGWLSSYSWFVVTTAHFTFNQINPRFLGSVYTNKPGKFKGDLWKINGEGLAGCVTGAVYVGLMYLFINFNN